MWWGNKTLKVKMEGRKKLLHPWERKKGQIDEVIKWHLNGGNRKSEIDKIPIKCFWHNPGICSFPISCECETEKV